MNFASLMSAAISKTEKKGTPSKISSTESNSKYLKRSEVEAARQQSYLAEQAAREAERILKAEKKRKADDDETERNLEREAKRQRLAEESKKLRLEEEDREVRERRKRLGLPDLPTPSEGDDADKEETLPEIAVEEIEEEELVAKLRGLSEPTRLFAETHAQRLRRYYELKNPRPAVAISAALVTPTPDNPIPTTLVPVPEAEMKVAAALPPISDSAARLYLSRQLTSWITLVLREWSFALTGRADATKRTFQGQAAANSMSQAVAHLKPLYRKLEKSPTKPSELPDDLLAPLAEIVRAAQERRYVDANDGYLKLSIGKAAWPIGVTMVGIHERSAREKLHESDNKAHIMSDETTRKILQSIKRCLSFAQTRWPPDDMGQLMG